MSTVTAGFQILPNGKDMHTDGVIPEVLNLVKESGLEFYIGPMETVIEGDLNEVLEIIKKAQHVGTEAGASECITNIKLHYKPSGIEIEDKVY
ncbi:thiamine-binding protein [Alkalihalobacillus sp. MEB130]|uniref:thiamine-binding protein n=1 Tax=Alkalihalobacillus sp. MEB130 TaxID=2976704 RepID=UPI0028DD77FF|nr:thiamine-binding protein [Alkalihalobacillus sp. MEB130]MDT8862169.1 thiamine-binding protein [Alkalihalobacillus sp. MEB130]